MLPYFFQTWNHYWARSIETAQVLEEMIAMAKDFNKGMS